jgi:hypothetical protein
MRQILTTLILGHKLRYQKIMALKTKQDCLVNQQCHFGEIQSFLKGANIVEKLIGCSKHCGFSRKFWTTTIMAHDLLGN